MVCLCKGAASAFYNFLRQFVDFEEFDRKGVELGVSFFGKPSAELGIWLTILTFALPFGGMGFFIGMCIFDKDLHWWLLKSRWRVRWFRRIYRLMFGNKSEPKIPGTPWVLLTPEPKKKKKKKSSSVEITQEDKKVVETAF